jgi:hypothetical protein
MDAFGIAPHTLSGYRQRYHPDEYFPVTFGGSAFPPNAAALLIQGEELTRGPQRKCINEPASSIPARFRNSGVCED